MPIDPFVNVWKTQGPSWVGDSAVYRTECGVCGAVSDEVYAIADALQIGCAACREREKGRKNRAHLDNGEVVASAKGKGAQPWHAS